MPGAARLVVGLLIVGAAVGCESQPNGPTANSAASSEGGFLIPATPFEASLRRYVAAPTSENTDTAGRLIPTDSTARTWTTGEAVLEATPTLERQIASRDTSALHLAVALQRISDGHVAEELMWATYTALKVMPEAWLEAMLRSTLQRERIPYLAGETMGRYDDPEGARRELTARRDAMRALKAPHLVTLRDSVVARLDIDIASFEGRQR